MLRPGFWSCFLVKNGFLKPLPKGGFPRGFFMGHSGAMVGPCWAIWGSMLGDLEAIFGFLEAKIGFWSCFLGKKRLFETLAGRWLPARVFHWPFGGYGGPMLGHLRVYVGRFGGYLWLFGGKNPYWTKIGSEKWFKKPPTKLKIHILCPWANILYMYCFFFNSRGCIEAAEISIPYSMYSRIFIYIYIYIYI